MKTVKLSSRKVFIAVALLVIIITLSAFSNYITLKLISVPLLTLALGFLFLNMFRLWSFGSYTFRFVLMVVLSIVLNILFGIGVSIMGLWVGIDKPLSVSFFPFAYMAILLIMTLITYLVNRGKTYTIEIPAVTRIIWANVFIPILLLCLSIGAMKCINTTGNGILIIVYLVSVIGYVLYLIFSRKKIPDGIYPYAILFIGLSFSLLIGLKTDYIIGNDVYMEKFIFDSTFTNGYWAMYVSNILDTCLSVSVLPTIYRIFTGLSGDIIFKTLYPLLCSVMPLIVYLTCKHFTKNSPYSFLGALFFIGQYNFLALSTLPRNSIALIFFIMYILLLVQEELQGRGIKILLLFMTIGCVLTHYSTAYVFFYLLCIVFVIRLIMRLFGIKIISRYSIFTEAGIIVFMAVSILYWYGYATNIALNSGISFIVYSLLSLNESFDMGAKDTVAQQAVGIGIFHIPSAMAFISVIIKFIFSWVTIGFSVLGVFLIGFRNKLENTNWKSRYFVIIFACVGVLVFAYTSAYVSTRYGLPRTYFQFAGILALPMILGGIQFAQWLKTNPLIILVLVVLLFFVGNSGMVDYFADRPNILYMVDGREYYEKCIQPDDQKVIEWINQNCDLEKYRIYADSYGRNFLLSQGMVSCESINILLRQQFTYGYAFIRTGNAKYNALQYNDVSYRTSEIMGRGDNTMLYSSGNASVYWLSDVAILEGYRVILK